MSSGNMRSCANCGNVVREGARFCGSCGTPVAQTEQQISSGGPAPATSSRGRRLRWVAVGAGVALLVAGGAAAALAVTGGDGSDEAILTEIFTESIADSTETDLFGDTTDIYGDTTDTTAVEGSIGQGVDQTCEDIVAFFTLAKETDIARGGNSVDDVERVAAEVSELASKAPADSTGEPRDSFVAIAGTYATYLFVLSELGLEPGPDALLDPTISAAFEDLEVQIVLGVLPWMGEHCSQEVLDQAAQLGASG